MYNIYQQLKLTPTLEGKTMANVPLKNSDRWKKGTRVSPDTPIVRKNAFEDTYWVRSDLSSVISTPAVNSPGHKSGGGTLYWKVDDNGYIASSRPEEPNFHTTRSKDEGQASDFFNF